MTDVKHQMILGIVEAVSKISEGSLSNGSFKEPDSETCLVNFLNVTTNELTSIVKFLVDYLPYTLYLQENEHVKDYVSAIIIKEVIFFLAQEDVRSMQFKNNIRNLQHEICNHVVNNIVIQTS